MPRSDQPYSAAEVAEKLGHGVDWFYANYARLTVAPDFMPPRLVSHGRYKFHRGMIDAWLTARTRRAILHGAAANDEFPVKPDIEQQRAALAAEYGAR